MNNELEASDPNARKDRHSKSLPFRGIVDAHAIMALRNFEVCSNLAPASWSAAVLLPLLHLQCAFDYTARTETLSPRPKAPEKTGALQSFASTERHSEPRVGVVEYGFCRF